MTKVTENWDDKAIVLEQVCKDGYTLRYASNLLQDDEDVVLTAISQIGDALQYASDRLRSDIHFCLECAKIDSDCCYYFIGDALKIFFNNDQDILSVEKIIQQKTQQEQNEKLLSKIKEKPLSNNNLFKINLLN